MALRRAGASAHLPKAVRGAALTLHSLEQEAVFAPGLCAAPPQDPGPLLTLWPLGAGWGGGGCCEKACWGRGTELLLQDPLPTLLPPWGAPLGSLTSQQVVWVWLKRKPEMDPGLGKPLSSGPGTRHWRRRPKTAQVGWLVAQMVPVMG